MDLVSSKSHADKLDIDKLENVSRNLRNLESKVDKLDVAKLVHVPVDLSKLSDVVKNYFVKKILYNAKIINIEDKISDITNLATTTALTAVESKVPIVKNLFKTTNHNTKNYWNWK